VTEHKARTRSPVGAAEAVTLHSVAKHANVSSATVSRVLSSSSVVAPETRARVMSAIESLGYRPNLLAQSLRLGRGRSVALVVGDIEQSFYSVMTSHIQAAIEEIGLDLLLFNLRHSEDRLWGLFERAKGLRLRGLLLAASHLLPEPKLESLAMDLGEANIPVISIGQRLQRVGLTSIVDDDNSGAITAMIHLKERGRFPVAFVGRIDDSALGRDRYLGYREALRQLDQPFDPDLVWNCVDKYRFGAGYETIGRALDAGLAFRGVLAASAELAAGAMAAVIDRGLRVPSDVAFVGFGGSEWAAFVRPGLTTVVGDIGATARQVRDTFFLLDGDDTPPALTVIEPKLEIRQST
jgi:DNA-binding LacI/PurR family transcriptional regulator